jgi:hypothetical protein
MASDLGDPRDAAVDEIPLIPEGRCDLLNERQLVNFASERRDYIQWSLALGKGPDRGEGHSPNTVANRTYRIVQFCEWVWDENGDYTTAFYGPCRRVHGPSRLQRPLTRR